MQRFQLWGGHRDSNSGEVLSAAKSRPRAPLAWVPRRVRWRASPGRVWTLALQDVIFCILKSGATSKRHERRQTSHEVEAIQCITAPKITRAHATMPKKVKKKGWTPQISDKESRQYDWFKNVIFFWLWRVPKKRERIGRKREAGNICKNRGWNLWSCIVEWIQSVLLLKSSQALMRGKKSRLQPIS